MAYNGNITTSVHGRRIGLQHMSTGQTGGSRGPSEYLVGPEAVRSDVTTGESTGTNLNPYGVSYMDGTSAASSCVYVLDPPVPGVEKTLAFGSTANGPLYVRCKAETIYGTSLGPAGATVLQSSGGGNMKLIGLTTAAWLALGVSSSGVQPGLRFAATT